MIRFFLTIIYLFQLTGCNGLFKKTINIIELTSKLEVNAVNHVPISLSNNISSVFSKNLVKTKIGSNNIISEPLINGNMLYTINNKATLSAYSLVNNKILWTKNIENRIKDQNFKDGGLVLDNNRLIATFGSRFLVMMNADDGNEILRKEFPDLIKTKPIMLDHNIVLIQTISNHLIAYDFNLSKMAWALELPNENIASSFIQSPIVYKNGIIIFNNNGSISYITAKLGQELWTLDLSKNEVEIAEDELNAFQCTPVFSNEFMYVATSAGEVMKINLTKGNIIWRIKAEDVHSLSINQNNLILTNNARQIALLNLDNGNIKWSANLYLTGDKNNIAAVSFLPFVTPSLTQLNMDDSQHNQSLNVVTSNGIMYSYDFSDKLNFEPETTKLPKTILYQIIKNDVIYLFDKSNMYKFQ